MPALTNNLKAQIIIAINALIALVVAFGVNISDKQTGAITLAVNALLSIWVGLTYKNSPMRKAEKP